MRSEEQAIKFEETVETIKRREKAEEFKRKELQVQQRTCSPSSAFFHWLAQATSSAASPFFFRQSQCSFAINGVVCAQR